MAPMLIMGLNQLGLDYEKPETLLGARILFAVVQGVMAILNLLILRKVNQAKDQTVISVKKPASPFAAAAAAAQGTQGTAAAAADSKDMTVQEYDSEQVKSQLKQLLIGTLITGFIHFKWGYVQPLILQAVMGPMNLYGAPLIMVHLLGKPAVGKYQRPFKADSSSDPFGLMKSLQPQADTADDQAAAPAIAAPAAIQSSGSGGSATSRKKRKD
jgi:hypothetical protein